MTRTPGRYREALDVTAVAIQSRARHYRTLVILVIAIVFASALFAAIERSWLFLAGVSMLVPLCAAFFSFDEWLVNRWRQHILRMWGTTDFDLVTYRRMVTSVEVLPARTVSAMLETLPSTIYALDPNATSYRTREMLGAVLHGLAARANYRSIASAATYAVAVASLLTSLAVRSWTPMAALALVPFLIVAARIAGAYRLRRALPDLATLQRPEAEAFAASVAQLDWGGATPLASAASRARSLNGISAPVDHIPE